jgi:twitching motility protein PilT
MGTTIHDGRSQWQGNKVVRCGTFVPSRTPWDTSTIEAMRAKASEDVLDPWLETLWERGGTDLLLTSGAPPFVRVDGSLVRLEDAADLDSDAIERVVSGVVGPEMMKEFEADQDVDFSFSWRDLARFRGNAFRQRGTVSLALRLIPLGIPSFGVLGLPPIIEQLVKVPHGLILVTGPTGSGKSTTLASMIDWINTNRACHILTIEDPIEYMHTHKQSAVTQREIGSDSPAFDRALRAALREDPDVLLVGEMRDPESIQTALTIAETGHLVLATLHTNDTGQALDRIVDVFPAERRQQIQVQLSATLAGVIYQRLLPRVNGGLVAAFEVLLADHAVRNLVREGKARQLRNVLTTRQSEGMQTLESCLADLVMNGDISMETAEGVSLFPQDIARLIETRMAQAAAAAAAQTAAAGRNGSRRRGV